MIEVTGERQTSRKDARIQLRARLGSKVADVAAGVTRCSQAGHLNATDPNHVVLFDQLGYCLNSLITAADLQLAALELADQIGVATYQQI